MRKVIISTHDDYHAAIFYFKEKANEAQKEFAFLQRRLSDEQKDLLYQDRLHYHEVYQQAFSLKKEYRLQRDDILLLVLNGNLEDEEDDEYFFISSTDHCWEDQDCSGVGIISLYFLNPNSTFMKDGGKWWSSFREFEQKKFASNCALLLILGAVTTEVTGLECHPERRGCIMDYCQSPTEIIEATKGVFQFCQEHCVPNLTKHPDGQAIVAIAKWLTEHPFSPHVPTPEALSSTRLSSEKVIISLHGIRTRGAWQKSLTSELNKRGFEHKPLDYGFFRAVKLVLPSMREKQVQWFLEEYTRVSRENGKKISIIAHSFGTYIVSSALEKYSEIEVDDIIFCGSVVRKNYPWTDIIRRQAKRVLNDYGRRDIWVRIAEWIIKDAGPSGAEGFIDEAGGKVQQLLRPKFRHSDYFYRLNYENTWIPFLLGQALSPYLERDVKIANWKFRIVQILVALLILVLLLWAVLR